MHLQRHITYTLLLLLFFCNNLAVQAQQPIDSLKLLLTQTPKPSEAALINSELCWMYLSISIDSSLHYGKKAVTIAQSIKEDALIAQTQNDYGTALLMSGDIAAAISVYHEAKKIREKFKDFNGTASLNLKLGNCYFKAGQIDSSMYYFTLALSYYEKENKVAETAQTLSNMGNVYYTAQLYEKALQYFNSSSQYLAKAGKNYELANTLVNIANTYLKKQDTVLALKQYHQSINVAQTASNHFALSAAYNNLGNIYLGKKKYADAAAYVKKSIELREKIGLSSELASSKLTMAIIDNATRQYQPALQLLRTIQPFFEQNNLTEQLITVYMQLSQAYGALGYPDSLLRYLNLYDNAKNKFTEAEMLKAATELDSKYQSEKKDAAIQQTKIQIKQRNLVISSIAVLLVLVLIIAFLMFQQQKLKSLQQTIRHKNKLQEQRLHISRELHDNIGSYLTYIKSSIENIPHEEFSYQHKITDVLKLTEETIAELRKTVWLMNKPEIHLPEWKTKLIDFYRKVDMVTVTSGELPEDIVMDTQKATHLFRCIQEAVNNALKHASPNHISINIAVTSNNIIISIQDDGTGFNTGGYTPGRGIMHIKERIAEIQGQVTFSGQKEKGTRVQITLPV